MPLLGLHLEEMRLLNCYTVCARALLEVVLAVGVNLNSGLQALLRISLLGLKLLLRRSDATILLVEFEVHGESQVLALFL